MAKLFKDIWNPGKDGSHAEERGFIRFAIIATGLLLAFLLLKKGNIINWVEAAVTIKRQEAQIERNQKTIDMMDANVHALTTNRDSLEKFAREKFHFAESGDDIYLIEE